MECPNCEKWNEIIYVESNSCIHCGLKLPIEEFESEKNSQKRFPPKPLLLKIGMFISGMNAILGLFYIFLIFLFTSISLETSRVELVDVLINGLFQIVSMWIIFISIYLRRTWARHAILLYWLIGFVALAFFQDFIYEPIRTFTFFAITIGFTIWYFYFKKNVVEYFSKIKEVSS